MPKRSAQELRSTEGALLQAAQRGDHAAFDRLISLYRRPLLSHCYRMVASVHDAEDLVQEAVLRAWRKLPTFEGRASFGAWLYRITTNVCLDFLDHRRRRILPSVKWPAADPTVAASEHVALDDALWVGPYPDNLLDDAGNPEAQYRRRESVRLAFIVALQSLPPRQRAILIFRDVLEWEAREVAALLATTVTSVNSALQRGRVSLKGRPTQAILDGRVSSDSGKLDEVLLNRYVRAWEEADVEGLVALLKADATMNMPPYGEWFQGRTAIATFLARSVWGGPHARILRLVPTGANTQPAFALYQWDDKLQEYLPLSLQVLAVVGHRIAHITGFVTPELFPYFGLPARLGLG